MNLLDLFVFKFSKTFGKWPSILNRNKKQVIIYKVIGITHRIQFTGLVVIIIIIASFYMKTSSAFSISSSDVEGLGMPGGGFVMSSSNVTTFFISDFDEDDEGLLCN